jgi:kynurenine 3-monooxygenase
MIALLFFFMDFVFSAVPLRRGVVIVGAGPAGLASAIALKNAGFRDVTVVERRGKASFESERAYLYLLDGRGQKFTNAFGLTDKITERALSGFAFQNLTEYLPTGQVNVKPIPAGPTDPKFVEKWWIPRSAMIDVLLTEIETINANSGGVNEIKLMFDSVCESISKSDRGWVCQIKSTKPSSLETSSTTLNTHLLLGCDGINSVVREALQIGTKDLYSESAGLRFKMITLKNRFKLPDTKQASIPEQAYIFRSKRNDQKNRVKLGLLPVKGDTPRTANIICNPDHVIWSKTDESSVQQYLSESFPQLNFSDFCAQDEIKRFAAAASGEFPRPTFATQLVSVFPPSGDVEAVGVHGEQTKEGVEASMQSVGVLLGDAAHVFPPDLGQGVNSALEDVFVLHQSIMAAAAGEEKAAAAVAAGVLM